MTNKSKEDLDKALEAEESVMDFATAGVKAPYTVFLGKGVDALDGYSYSMEP